MTSDHSGAAEVPRNSRRVRGGARRSGVQECTTPVARLTSTTPNLSATSLPAPPHSSFPPNIWCSFNIPNLKSWHYLCRSLLDPVFVARCWTLLLLFFCWRQTRPLLQSRPRAPVGAPASAYLPGTRKVMPQPAHADVMALLERIDWSRTDRRRTNAARALMLSGAPPR